MKIRVFPKGYPLDLCGNTHTVQGCTLWICLKIHVFPKAHPCPKSPKSRSDESSQAHYPLPCNDLPWNDPWTPRLPRCYKCDRPDKETFSDSRLNVHVSMCVRNAFMYVLFLYVCLGDIWRQRGTFGDRKDVWQQRGTFGDKRDVWRQRGTFGNKKEDL